MGAIDSIKGTVELLKQVSEAELKANLVDRILDIQITMQSLIDENAALKDELRELKARDNLHEKFEYRDNAYWDRDSSQQIAYCKVCLAKHEHRIPLSKNNDGSGWCQGCTSCFSDVFLGTDSDN